MKDIQNLTFMQRFRFRSLLVILLIFSLSVACAWLPVRNSVSQGLSSQSVEKGNVIFIHPDGTSPAHWGAARFLSVGPDGRLNWDRMSHLAVYLGHMKNQLTGTSNAGAVTHATGVKVEADSFGLDAAGQPITSAAGTQQTIMQTAVAQGYKTALINSGIISEPGTGAFVARVNSRREHAEITRQIIESGVDMILGGGEIWYLPRGTAGRYARFDQSQREDGMNLTELAKQKGYTVVYTRDELLGLPDNVTKILGVFAAGDTYNSLTEEELKQQILPPYEAKAPTVAEMLQVTLKRMSQTEQPFFVVLEEEGTDNFSNANNAKDAIEAVKRADDAIGVAMQFVDQNPRTLLLTAADSDAGGLEVLGGTLADMPPDRNLPTNADGAPVDGREGTGTPPFLAAPDAQGQRLPFAVVWTGGNDSAGAIIAKAYGLNANLLPNTIDNTEVYRLMYGTLFGAMPGRQN